MVILEMANKGKPSRNDLRKVRTILSLVGSDGSREISTAIGGSNYRKVKDLHVYVSKESAEGNDFHLSIWDQPKERITRDASLPIG